MRKSLWPALVTAALILTGGVAAAIEPQGRESSPAAEVIMNGRNLEFALRFDGPVDHAAARLEIMQGGNVVRTLRPRLDSAPTVLFASGEGLPPGRYTLRWHIGGDVSDGEIPFSVRQ